MIVTPIPTPAVLYSAKQVRQVLAAAIIQFLDGSEEVFLSTPQGQTFVPTAGGNVVPNPGDWVMNTRPVLNTPVGGPGNAPFAQQVGVPVAPNPNGPFLVLTNAQFQASYSSQYALSAPNQGVVQ